MSLMWNQSWLPRTSPKHLCRPETRLENSAMRSAAETQCAVERIDDAWPLSFLPVAFASSTAGRQKQHLFG